MNETIRTQIAALEDLRLPELQARSAEVLGEPTRTPNRRFLIRRITEALLARTEGEQPAPAQSTAPAEPTLPSEPAPAAAAETTTPLATVPGSSMDVEQARRVIMENVDPMGYDTAEQYVEECYGQVAPEAMPGLLVEAAQIILDNAAAAEPQPESAAEPHGPEPATSEPAPAAEPAPESDEVTEPAEPTESATAAEPAEPTEPAPDAEPAAAVKLTKLDVPALQALHLELIGRPTSSSDKAYLVWRLRQAQKGKIPVGQRERRATATEPQDHKVLPLRMEAELVAKLDEARERLGLKSRMDLFRRALHAYLAAAGEHDVAALFAPEA
jgi:hypothetical protein